MFKLGTGLLITGISLIAFGGFEKVLIYSAFVNHSTNMESVLAATPSYIWNISNWTIGLGTVLIVISIICFLPRTTIEKIIEFMK